MTTLDRFDDGGTYRKAMEASLEHTFKVPSCYLVKRSEDFALAEKTASGQRLRYPLHTADEAMLSLGYFLRYGNSLEPALQKTAALKISSALAEYNLQPNVELEKLASLQLGYTDADNNSLNGEEDAALRRLFNIGTSQDVQELTEHFAGQSPRGKRRVAFLAKEASVTIPGMEAYLGTEFGSDLEMHVNVRGHLMDDRPKAKALLAKVASLAPEEAVSAIEDFDKEHSLQRLYVTHGLADPVQTVYGDTLSKTASYAKSVELGDYSLSADQFSAFLSDKQESLETAFGPELVSELTSRPSEVYESLPVPHKQAIAEMYTP